jgi:hypothetical protein
VNLNELEFSDTNLVALEERGFRIKSDESMAVKESEELAQKVLKWAARNTSLNIHYCPSSLKDAFQLRNRLKRRARNVAKLYENITPEGLLTKGTARPLKRASLPRLRKYLISRYELPPDLIAVDREKRRLEMACAIAEKLAKLEPELKFTLVEEYPTYDRLETLVIPLG